MDNKHFSAGSRILVTGVAGFIGMSVVRALNSCDAQILGVDIVNDYYDVKLKEDRLSNIVEQADFEFCRLDLSDTGKTLGLFLEWKPTHVIHLAAQPGVRYSITHPHAYAKENLVAFLNILEGCRAVQIQHLIYASSSSVYGGNTKVPFSESDNVDHPVSLYAATKKANELMAHTYSHLYGLPTTGLRFFTVYGPWGRPDMAPFLFAKAILNGEPIKVFNHGEMMRDFTYIDDIVKSIVRLIGSAATPDQNFDSANPAPGGSNAPYKIFNIGNSDPVKLLDFIGSLERAIGRTAIKNMFPMQAGDVIATSADTSRLENWINFKPDTPLAEGIEKFVAWYKDYYGYA